MFNEKRNGPRVNTHIVTELNTGNAIRMCGYIENLSENGMGILSLEQFVPGTQIEASFFLPGTARKFSSRAQVLNSNHSVYNLYYHSIRFDTMSAADREAIRLFVQDNRELLKNPA